MTEEQVERETLRGLTFAPCPSLYLSPLLLLRRSETLWIGLCRPMSATSPRCSAPVHRGPAGQAMDL
jgi:hypothetical protein